MAAIDNNGIVHTSLLRKPPIMLLLKSFISVSGTGARRFFPLSSVSKLFLRTGETDLADDEDDDDDDEVLCVVVTMLELPILSSALA